ncbi:Ionotropic receptor 118 [Halyomorpha halys]|nr:Ionotropic receptor 118 [Halyomorpha halys]
MKLVPPLMTLFCTSSLPLDCASVILSVPEAQRLVPLVAPSFQRILIIAEKHHLVNIMIGLEGRRAVVIACGTNISYFKTEFEPQLNQVSIMELSKNLPGDKIDLRREVILTTFNCSIFAVLGPVTEDGHPEWFDGLELNAVATILEWRGLSWRVLLPWRGYGEVYLNGTIEGGGIKSFLAQALADIALCSIWITPNLFSTMRPTASDRFRLCSRILVPQPQASVTYWHSFFMTLPLTFWCIHIISALASAAIIHFCEINLSAYNSSNDAEKWIIKFGSSLYKAFTICFQGQLNGTFTRFGSKVLQLSWAVLVVIASSIFSSFLVARLTTPLLPNPVDSLEDMVRLGYKWTSGFGYVPSDNADAYFDLRGDVEREWFTTQVSTDEIIVGKTCLYAFDFESIYFLDEPQLYDQKFISTLVPSSRCMAQNLISTLTRRLSSYSNVLSSGLANLHESGIFSKINNDVLRSPRMRRYMILESEAHQPVGGTPLSLVQLRGAFYLLFAGLLLSIAVFLLELLTRKEVHIFKFNTQT